MTREEAIERLKQNKAAAEFYAGMVQNTNAIENELKDIEAIDMAIEALSEPIDENREIIKDILKMMPTAYLLEALGVATFDELMDSERTGEWEDIDNHYRLATCSHCHKVTMFEKWGEYTKPYDFCPNCGADMRGEEE